MSRYQKTSSAPFIIVGVLLVAFIGIVVFATRGDRGEQGASRAGPTNAPIGDAAPEEDPAAEEEAAPEPPPAPKLTADEAEQALRRATAAWRAFTLELCRKEKWPSKRAVAFLEKVTWNDRDKDKQHANGLRSIRLMLETDAEDPVALAEALQDRGSLSAFFATNWSKVDVDWSAVEPEVKVLDDAWKPKRIQWGFPLDTPVRTLQEFKVVHLAVALDAWRAFAGSTINEMEIDDGAKGQKFLAAVGNNPQLREAKMHAALRVLVGKPEASIKDVVQEFSRRLEADGRDKLAEAIAQKVDAAIAAAEKAG